MKKYIRIFLLLYLAGFVLGIAGANFLLKKTGSQTSLLPFYTAFAPDVERRLLFGQLLIKRGSWFLVGALCGTTVLGVPLGGICLLWAGFLGGNLITLFLLEYGLKGMAAGIACLFPQALFYVPGWLFFFFVVVQMSQKSWAGLKKNKEDHKAYFFFLSMAAIILLLGIWTESYVNQNVLQYVMETWL